MARIIARRTVPVRPLRAQLQCRAGDLVPPAGSNCSGVYDLDLVSTVGSRLQDDKDLCEAIDHEQSWWELRRSEVKVDGEQTIYRVTTGLRQTPQLNMTGAAALGSRDVQCDAELILIPSRYILRHRRVGRASRMRAAEVA